jgi:hypothetical protein
MSILRALKIALQAQKARMLLENVSQDQGLPNSTAGHIGIYI